MADLRRFRSRVPFGLVATFARNLQAGVARLDAIGGDLVEARVPGLPPVVLVRHPDVLRELLIDRDADFTKARGLRLARQILGDGLLTSEPPDHTRRRRLVLPAFHHGRLVGYGETMVALANAEAAGWTDGAPFDAVAAMSRLALAIAGRTLFGADVLSDADRVSAAVHNAMAAFDGAQFPFADKLTWLPLPANRTSRRARAVLDEVVYRVIAEHRSSGPTDDLLGILLEARDEDSGEALTDLELRDEAMTLLLAGHETTATALAWTWLLLAQHPDAEARLHAEVDAVDGDLSLASLADLPYTRAVFAESLRLYPPAWAVGREAARDTSLGGHPVPRRSTVLFAPLHLHRDEQFWDAPDAFLPQRHLRANDRHKFAFVPFSVGRRGCVGERFAWAEGTLVLAAIARRWRLVLDGDPPRPHGSVTLRPAGPLRMRPEVR
ncbi:cytochrome P450 [Rubrivirga sp. IMCC45206]|uniref:cytochrome P450 n=1 Tax=Rubrivirga sp. IMCC45206 TaxID=3391614 RepID=UPI0039900B25